MKTLQELGFIFGLTIILFFSFAAGRKALVQISTPVYYLLMIFFAEIYIYALVKILKKIR